MILFEYDMKYLILFLLPWLSLSLLPHIHIIQGVDFRNRWYLLMTNVKKEAIPVKFSVFLHIHHENRVESQVFKNQYIFLRSRETNKWLTDFNLDKDYKCIDCIVTFSDSNDVFKDTLLPPR